MTSSSTDKPAKPKSSWLNLLIDFGPLLIFFLTYRHYSPADSENSAGVIIAVTKSTINFMIATVFALIISKWRLGHVAPMVWLSTALILGFGALTVFFNDPFWIQIKPTAIYLIFGTVLFLGLLRGKPMLRYLLEAAFEGLTHEGWMKLSRNWAVFFLCLALLNEVLRHTLSFGGWLQAKLWVFTTLSFLFTFSQIPMIMRHGMGDATKDKVVENTPKD